MNTAETQALKDRIAALEAKVNDTPERRQIDDEERQERQYLEKLDKAVITLRKEMPALVKQYQRNLQVLQTNFKASLGRMQKNRTSSMQIESKKRDIKELPVTVAVQLIDTSRIPEPRIFVAHNAPEPILQRRDQRVARLNQVRQRKVNELLDQLIRETGGEKKSSS